MSNIEKYKKDLVQLIDNGSCLFNSLYYQYDPDQFNEQAKINIKDEEKIKELKKAFISFSDNYQTWYSEAFTVLKFLLPDRIDDFVKFYEKPKNRKSIGYENYVIEDCLQDLVVRFSDGERKVGPEAALHQFQQQLNILKSAQRRFESSLFDIKQLIQADMFDSELEAAKELNKKGFMRGAGAVAGVVLESHLSQVCENHKIKIAKADPTISYLNDLLKAGDVIEIADWRFIQRLGDIRNKCDHKKEQEPTKEEIGELIDGVDKIIKSVF